MSDAGEAPHEVIVDGLADPSPSGEEAFHAAMLSIFGLDEERSRVLVASLPRTLYRSASVDEARRMAEALRSAGATCRIVSPPPAVVIPAAESEAAHAPSPPDPVAPDRSERAVPPPPRAPSTPQASASTIPLAGSGGAATIECRECGLVQPETNKRCARCAFPLGRKKAPAPAPPPVTPGATFSASRPAAARREDESRPCRAVLLTAAGLLWLGAAGSLAQALHSGESIALQLIPAGVGVLFGFWILSGSGASRVVLTILCSLGVIAGLVGRVVMPKLAAAGATEEVQAGLELYGTVALVQSFYLVLLIALFWGRGSVAKAWLLGVPCVLIQAWSLHAVTIGGAGEALATAGEGMASMVELAEAGELIQRQRFDAAIEAVEPVVEKARAEGNDVLLGHALTLLGVAHLGAGRLDEAVEALEEAVIYLPEEAEVRDLLERATAARDQRDDAQQRREEAAEAARERREEAAERIRGERSWEPPDQE